MAAAAATAVACTLYAVAPSPGSTDLVVPVAGGAEVTVGSLVVADEGRDGEEALSSPAARQGNRLYE